MNRVRARVGVAVLLTAGLAASGCSSGSSPSTAAADFDARQGHMASADHTHRGLCPQADSIARSALMQAGGGQPAAAVATVPEE